MNNKKFSNFVKVIQTILMTTYHTWRNILNIRLIIFLAVAIIIVVMFTYTNQFGFNLSTDHSKWAEFGSFFGGILGPILAFSSLLYLAIQMQQQTKEYREARIKSEIKQIEDSISLYLAMLQPKLFENDPALGSPISELILKMSNDDNQKYIKSELCKIGMSARAETLVMWSHIAGNLSFIKSINEIKYLNQINLIAVTIGYDICSALDDVVKFVSGLLNFEKHFSSK